MLNFREILARLRGRWQGLSQTKKIVTVLAGAVILSLLFYTGQMIMTPRYATLFTGLNSTDAGNIAANLKTMKIPYQLSNGGGTILVPESQVPEARIQLASAGDLPGSGQGFALFDQSQWGESDAEEQVRYQRALQGELERTLTGLDGVENARVHLVLPQKSIFLDNTNSSVSTASVVLQLKPGTKLKPEQIKGVSDLLVGSVEGLKPQNIYIIDTQGNVLNDFTQNDNIGSSSSKSGLDAQQQITRNYEKELEDRVRQMLTTVFGPNNSAVMVTSDIDFSQNQSSTTTVLPGQVLSQQTSTENSNGSAATGVPGANSNLGSSTGAGGANNGTTTKSDNTVNYENSKKTESIVQPPGQLKRLSVSVVLDNSKITANPQQVQAVVANAVGLDPSRGDQIYVTGMNFDKSLAQSEQKAMAAQAKQDQQNMLYRNIALGAAGLLLLAGLIVVLWRRRNRKEAMAETATRTGTGENIALEALQKESQESAVELKLPPGAEKKKRLRDVASEKPVDVAQLLKVWMRE